MPNSEVTIKAAFLNAADVPVSFADVSADDYYYEAVLWAVSQGITLGTDDAHFSPDADCARGPWHRHRCILSSKNPWFCQSEFLGIATGIPW